MKRIIDIDEELYNKAKNGEIKGYDYLHLSGKLAESELLNEVEAEDCISRQAVIDMTGLSEWFSSSDDYNEFVFEICKLPSVTPKIEPRKGHWMVTDKTGHLVWECNKCGWQQGFNTNFCPDCGADMREVTE